MATLSHAINWKELGRNRSRPILSYATLIRNCLKELKGHCESPQPVPRPKTEGTEGRLQAALASLHHQFLTCPFSLTK